MANQSKQGAVKGKKVGVAGGVRMAEVEQVFSAGGEEVVKLDAVKVVFANLNRPGFDMGKTPVDDLRRELRAAGGQLNPVLCVRGEDGQLVLVAGYRRYRALLLETAEGRHDGTVRVKVVTPAPGNDLPLPTLAALVNFKENNDAKLPTGIEGRISSFAGLKALGWTLADISRYCGSVALDVVIDALAMAEPHNEKLKKAVAAFEAESATWDEVKPAKKEGEEPVTVTHPSGPFSVARLCVRGGKDAFHAGKESEAKTADKFTTWGAFRRVAHLKTVDAQVHLREMKAGVAHYEEWKSKYRVENGKAVLRNPPKAAPPAAPPAQSPVTVTVSSGSGAVETHATGTPAEAAPVTAPVTPAPAPAPEQRTTNTVRDSLAAETAVRKQVAGLAAQPYEQLRAVLSVNGKVDVARALDLLDLLDAAMTKACSGPIWNKAREAAAVAHDE